MREILIAERAGDKVDAMLFCVEAIQILPGAQLGCQTKDGLAFIVSRECVHRLGSVDLAVSSAPEQDGLWALNYAGRWVEARRR